MRERPIDAKYGLDARFNLPDGKEHLPVLFGDERDSTYLPAHIRYILCTNGTIIYLF